MHYRLHTLLIVLALGPPVLAGAWIFWDTTWRALIVLAIPIVFAGAIVALGMTISIPLIVIFELASDLSHLLIEVRKSDN